MSIVTYFVPLVEVLAIYRLQTERRIHGIYEKYVSSWGNDEILMNNDFDIDWQHPILSSRKLKFQSPEQKRQIKISSSK